MNPILRKISLSIFAMALFGSYATYEHLHNDSADLVTLIMSDLASRGDTAHVSETPATTETLGAANPQAMTPEQYQSYIAGINAKAATEKNVAPAPVQTTPAVTNKRRRNDDEGEDDRPPVSVQAQQTSVQTQTNNVAQQAAQEQTAAQQLAQQQAAEQAAVQAQASQSAGKYHDGTYTGQSVNAFYGYVQVEAIISGGKITDVKFLSYPSDRSTSRYINSQAMPILTQEAVQSQSAQVDGVSGATDTSQAFIQSLTSALSQA